MITAGLKVIGVDCEAAKDFSMCEAARCEDNLEHWNAVRLEYMTASSLV
jgi:hypothetical protein